MGIEQSITSATWYSRKEKQRVFELEKVFLVIIPVCLFARWIEQAGVGRSEKKKTMTGEILGS